MQGIGPVEKRELVRREEEAPVSAEENEALVRRFFEEGWVILEYPVRPRRVGARLDGYVFCRP
jgi:hypothetical protein